MNFIIVAMGGLRTDASRNISTRFCKASIPVTFSEAAVGLHFLGNPMGDKY